MVPLYWRGKGEPPKEWQVDGFIVRGPDGNEVFRGNEMTGKDYDGVIAGSRAEEIIWDRDAEIEALKHDLDQYIKIANEYMNESERLRAALEDKATIQRAIYAAFGCVKPDYRSARRLDEAAGIIADFVIGAQQRKPP